MQELGGAGLLQVEVATEEVDDKATLFAPTNEAFDAIADTIQGLSPEELKAVRPQTFLGPHPT